MAPKSLGEEMPAAEKAQQTFARSWGLKSDMLTSAAMATAENKGMLFEACRAVAKAQTKLESSWGFNSETHSETTRSPTARKSLGSNTPAAAKAQQRLERPCGSKSSNFCRAARAMTVMAFRLPNESCTSLETPLESEAAMAQAVLARPCALKSSTTSKERRAMASNKAASDVEGLVEREDRAFALSGCRRAAKAQQVFETSCALKRCGLETASAAIASNSPGWREPCAVVENAHAVVARACGVKVLTRSKHLSAKASNTAAKTGSSALL
mmetsp:Transcript_16560/g.58829  ORF Transcript_16560/g.58829 Transcript_16560/m.58829 type:complete len:270 (-) Transcript_16560:1189-1998(-)